MAGGVLFVVGQRLAATVILGFASIVRLLLASHWCRVMTVGDGCLHKPPHKPSLPDRPFKLRLGVLGISTDTQIGCLSTELSDGPVG